MRLLFYRRAVSIDYQIEICVSSESECFPNHYVCIFFVFLVSSSHSTCLANLIMDSAVVESPPGEFLVCACTCIFTTNHAYKHESCKAHRYQSSDSRKLPAIKTLMNTNKKNLKPIISTINTVSAPPRPECTNLKDLCLCR